MNEKFICCLCYNVFDGYGNNPDGAMYLNKDGEVEEPSFSSKQRCCNECNAKFVIPGRLYKLNQRIKKNN